MTTGTDSQSDASDLAPPCRAWISSIQFRDGTILELQKDDTIVFVGPHNCGNSELLGSILSLASTGACSSAVVQSINLGKSGTSHELVDWLRRRYTRQGEFPNCSSHGFGLANADQTIAARWDNTVLDELTPLFIYTCRRESRIMESSAPNSIPAHETKSHPLHRLYDDADLEENFSMAFHEAFGTDLVINWRGGTPIPIHVGPRPVRTADADRVSNEYCEAVKKLPLLSDQGDDMRSFASLLFALESMQSSVLLIDEPEAFLRRPQARRIGEILAKAGTKQRQVIVATHSTDVLRGVLSVASPNTKIIRFSRADGQTTKVLEPSAVEKLWSDPVLRFSNALDGLFHEATVLCEGDADCRFYEAIATAIAPGDGRMPIDLYFAYTAGKDYLPEVQRALKTLGVPVAVIADFDLLQQDSPLQELVGDSADAWKAISKLIAPLRAAIDNGAPTLARTAFAKGIFKMLALSDGAALSDKERDSIREMLKETSPWSIAKTQGKTMLSGESAVHAEKLLADLQMCGVFVVPIGEVESFCRAAGGRGPRWVAEVLKRPFKDDADLVEARDFVNKVVAYCLII
ncbi:MAG: ATP-dependent nuclease [Steroidobacteraceae bacterium]